jgi:hypothetical protein
VLTPFLQKKGFPIPETGNWYEILKNMMKIVIRDFSNHAQSIIPYGLIFGGTRNAFHKFIELIPVDVLTNS